MLITPYFHFVYTLQAIVSVEQQSNTASTNENQIHPLRDPTLHKKQVGDWIFFYLSPYESLPSYRTE